MSVARLRSAARLATSRVRRHSRSLALAATSAAAAYLLASLAFGPEDAYFAPIAAVVCIGIAAGQRIRRGLEIAAGVAVGLVAADLLVRLIGNGAWQLGIAVLFATAAAVALGAGPLMSNQAAVAAILVVALSPNMAGNPWIRLGDAVIGAAVALAVNAVTAPDPRREVRSLVEDVMSSFVAALRDVSSALSERDLATAERGLERAELISRRLTELDEGLQAARETAQLALHRVGSLERLQPLLLVRQRLDVLAVTTRSTCRAAANAVRHGQRVDPRLTQAVDGLAAALDELTRWLDGEGDADTVCSRALDAATSATSVLRDNHAVTANVLAANVRTGVVDILRATGIDHRTAVSTLERTAGTADARLDERRRL